ncbi:MAG: flavin reductase family protein [Bacteroidales bacterium]|nr:flavin reductase family protein [Bacteroidales bacterium]
MSLRKSIEIDPVSLNVQIHNLWKNQWLLLTSGDFNTGHFNTMTVAWGSLGMMWNKPFAMVVVRPSRYTFDFMNQYPDFTLTAFPKEFHKDLSYLGKVSGRDEDKIAQTRLHPCAARIIGSPVFQEAELAIECRKTYWNDFLPDHFLDPTVRAVHEPKNIHRMYFGEIIHIEGDEKFISTAK